MPHEAEILEGKRIVVVEDDFMLASDICRQLRNLGATVLGPAPTPFYAMQLINRRTIDAAVLDIRLHGATVFEVADALIERGVPILFATAYDRSAIPARFHDVPLLEKPLDRVRLLEEIRAMIVRPLRASFALAQTEGAGGQYGEPTHIFARTAAKSLRH